MSDLDGLTDFGYAFAPDQSGEDRDCFPEEGMTIFHKVRKKKKFYTFKRLESAC